MVSKVDFSVEDKGLNRVRLSLRGIEQTITIGVHEDAEDYPSGVSVATVAAVHEFGTDTVPQRSFLRGWLDSGGTKKLGDTAQDQIGKVVDGAKAESLADRVGKQSVAGVVRRIESGIAPGLSDRTLADPERDPLGVALVDTRRLIDAITSEVS